MKKINYLKFLARIEEIQRKLEVLDNNNPIENQQIMLLRKHLDGILIEIEETEKRDRLSRFKLITGSNEESNRNSE